MVAVSGPPLLASVAAFRGEDGTPGASLPLSGHGRSIGGENLAIGRGRPASARSSLPRVVDAKATGGRRCTLAQSLGAEPP